MPRPSLQQRIVLGLLGYMLLLGVIIIGLGYGVHETAERHAFKAILRAELVEYLRRSRDDAAYRWSDTETLALRVSALDAADAPFAALPEGLHDEVHADGREYVVLIRIDGSRRIALWLDISDFEARERSLLRLVLSLAALLVAALALGAAWLVRRLAEPLRQLATAITALQPKRAVSCSASAAPQSRSSSCCPCCWRWPSPPSGCGRPATTSISAPCFRKSSTTIATCSATRPCRSTWQRCRTAGSQRR